MGNELYHSCKRCNGSGTEHTYAPRASDRSAGLGGIIVCRSCNGGGIDFYNPRRTGSDTASTTTSGGRGIFFALLVIFFSIFTLFLLLAEVVWGSTESKDLPAWFMVMGLLLPFVVMYVGRKGIGGTAGLCFILSAGIHYFF